MLNYNEKEENRNCGCGNFMPMNNQNNTVQEIENANIMDECECQEKNRVREEMLMKIRELEFAIVELAQYLDTHPDSPKALCLHREYCKRLKDLKEKYQKVYGPLTIYFPCNKWRWLEEPWPWERGN